MFTSDYIALGSFIVALIGSYFTYKSYMQSKYNKQKIEVIDKQILSVNHSISSIDQGMNKGGSVEVSSGGKNIQIYITKDIQEGTIKEIIDS